MLNSNRSNCPVAGTSTCGWHLARLWGRYYLCCKARQWKCPTLLRGMKVKVFSTASESWGPKMVPGPHKSLFEGKGTSSVSYQPCYCQWARDSQRFMLLARLKNCLGLMFPGNNTKSRSKSFFYQHSKGSELPRIQDSVRESLHWKMCWGRVVLGN